MQVQIPAILQSKKFLAAVLASGMSLAGFKYGLTFEQIATSTSPLYIFIGAQGLADMGKEREKVARSSSMTFAQGSSAAPPKP